MFKLFTRSQKRGFNHFLALDIGTEFVKAVIVELTDAKNGRVQGYACKKLALGDLQSGAITDLANIIKISKEAIAEANRHFGSNPAQMILGVAGELVRGSTITLSYRRTDPTAKINPAELKNIIHKIQWKAFEKLRSDLAYETGQNEIDIKLINAAIIAVSVDGYPVLNPIGFQGKDVEITVFNAFSPVFHFGAIQTVVAELNYELLAITAEPYALAKTWGQNRETGGDAIILDIGSSTTDLAIVKDGNLLGGKMFTVGGRVFTKRIAQSLNVSFAEAEDIKLAYANDQLEKPSAAIVKQALGEDAEIWLAGVAIVLNEMGLDTLPAQILLCGGGSLLPEIKEILEGKEWLKQVPFRKKPRIRHIQPEQINSLELGEGVKNLGPGQAVTPLALANIALELAGEEKLLQKILQKAIRLMQV